MAPFETERTDIRTDGVDIPLTLTSHICIPDEQKILHWLTVIYLINYLSIKHIPKIGTKTDARIHTNDYF